MLATPESSVIGKNLGYYQSNAQDWEYSALSRELQRWIDILDTELSLKLPTRPLMAYEPIRNAYATYQWSHGALGVPDTITINTATLDRPAAYVVRTLCHELLHLWQQYHGRPSPKGNYHNDEYVARALDCGILINHQGCTVGHTELFSALVTKHGIDLPDMIEAESGLLIPPTGGIETPVYGTRRASGKGSSMRKWCCDCTNVRCAVDLLAVCARCAKPFALAD